jgi:hypothetical protein
MEMNEMKKLPLSLCSILFLFAILFGGLFPAHAATVLEETGFIFGFGGENYSFVADQAPPVYRVTLTDLEFPAAFDILAVAITTSTDNVAELLAQGNTTFGVELGTTYFANVLGLADDEFGAGLFGIKIAPVPIPGALWLLGSGLIGIVGIRKKFKK